MAEIAVSEFAALAYQENKITLAQLKQLARVEPGLQDNLVKRIVGKSEEKTKEIIDTFLLKQRNPSKKNTNLLKLRSGDISEIRVDSKALEYRIIAENLMAIIPQTHYLINCCLATPDWRIDDKTSFKLRVKLGLLRGKIDKILEFLQQAEVDGERK